MKVSYFPGCTLKNKAKELDKYSYKCAEVLGITLEEIEAVNYNIKFKQKGKGKRIKLFS